MPQLTETKIKNIKPDGTIKRFFDAGGLYLETSKAGSKIWRWKYHFNGKEKRLTFGHYPEISLAQARLKRDKARLTLAEGIDPTAAKKKRTTDKQTFFLTAEQWFTEREPILAASHTKTMRQRLERYAYPAFGDKPIAEISPAEILSMVKYIEARGALEQAKRTLGICSQVFRWAVAMQYTTSDPCRDLRGALAPRQKKRFAAITTPQAAGELMRRIYAYQSPITKAALIFSALTFQRPGEIRQAEWKEIDWQDKCWLIPTNKMKMREPHFVPLARQTLELLEWLRSFTGREQYLFPCEGKRNKPMSENTVRSAIRRMGYSNEEMTAHGFRSMASTILNEKGYHFDVIEAQLAHTGIDKIRAIYNRAKYKQERRELMQSWADLLDELRQ